MSSIEEQIEASASSLFVRTCPMYSTSDESITEHVYQQLNKCILFHYEADAASPGYKNAMDALRLLSGGHRAVCQKQFRRNDIVWICKQCQKDETCVQCNECFQASNHTGHEVFFYHSQAGGCCDCGDTAAWEALGCCTAHGKKDDSNPVDKLPLNVRLPASTLFDTLVREIISFFCVFSNPAEGLADANSEYGLLIREDGIRTPTELVALVLNHVEYSDLNHIDTVDTLKKQGCIRIFSGSLTDCLDRSEVLISQGVHSLVISEFNQKRIVAVKATLQWLIAAAESSDGVSGVMCSVLTGERVAALMNMDPHQTTAVKTLLHRLLITLMANPAFKETVAIAYAQSFAEIAKDHANGIGTHENSLFGLSVQFLNREVFCQEITQRYGFFKTLMNSLRLMLQRSTIEDNLMHPILVTRKYLPLVADLKIIFSSLGMSRVFAAVSLDAMLSLLSEYQLVHQQKRIDSGNHVEEESKNWVSTFNLDLSLMSLLEHMLNWFSMESAARSDLVVTISEGDQECEVALPSIQEFILKIVSAVLEWQKSANFRVTQCRQYRSMNSLDVFVPSSCHSFHVVLYRYLAASIKECCKFDRCIDTIQNILAFFADHPWDVSYIIEVLCRVFSFETQIRFGMWKRNGHSLEDQMSYYSDPPFCRIFKDLDIFLVQCCVTTMNANVFVNMLMYHFNLVDLLWVVVYPSTASLGEKVMPGTVSMLEGMLLVIINLITELPIPCISTEDRNQRIRSLIRREVLHKLCQRSFAYTDLIEYVCSIGDYEQAVIAHLEGILEEIAVKNRVTKEFDTATFSLKSELWGEYDPSFPHLKSSAHQTAMEARPKPSKASPYVAAPMACYSLFADVRTSLLSEILLYDIIKSVFFSYAATICVNAPYASNSPYRLMGFVSSENLLLRCIHLLTLQVHMHCDADSSTAFSFGEYFTIETEQLPYSFLLVLCDLFDAISSDDKVKYWIEWILIKLEALEPCKEYIASRLEAVREQSRQKDMEVRRKRAREQAMKKIQSSAASFAATQNMQDVEEDSDDEAEESLDESAQTACIICHQHSTGEPIGFLGYCQKSTVLSDEQRFSGIRLQTNADELTPPKGLYFHCCGHCMHYTCFEHFFVRSVASSVNQDNILLDPSKGQFQCPMCKRLCNIIVPSHPVLVDVTAPDTTPASLETYLFRLVEEEEEQQGPLLPPIETVFSFGRALSRLITRFGARVGDGATAIATETAETSLGLLSRRFFSSMCSIAGLSVNQEVIGNSFQQILKAVAYTMAVDELNTEYNDRARALNTKTIQAALLSIRSALVGLNAVATAKANLSSMLRGQGYTQGLEELLRRNITSLATSDREDVGRCELLLPFIFRAPIDTLNFGLVVHLDDWPTAMCFASTVALGAFVQILVSEIAVQDFKGKNSRLLPIDEVALPAEVEDIVLCVSRCVCNHFNSLGVRWSGAVNPHALTLAYRRWVSFLNTANKMVATVSGNADAHISLHYSTVIATRVINSWLQPATSRLPLPSSPRMLAVPFQIVSIAYRIPATPQLIPLPTEYTELHREVVSICDYEFPALCLVCGAILDAHGKGACTRHVLSCSGSAGLVFLLQDCALLFINEGRCCYFPSPYIDVNGEKHKHYKGRPLYFDSKRYEAIKRMWLHHGITNEVLRIRSSSSHVIIIGHY